MNQIALITPFISSLNLGDQIVDRFCSLHLQDMFPKSFFVRIPAYHRYDERSKYIMDKCQLAFFCGTGPLRNDLAEHWQFDVGDYDNKVVLFGCGWNRYEDGGQIEDTISKLNGALSEKFHHSVRDNYTKLKLQSHHSLNTSCPTTWNIDPNSINYKKSKNVLLTLNAVRGHFYKDRMLCEFLEKNYEKVYFIAQSPFDSDYVKSMGIDYEELSPNLAELEAFCCNVDFDYIGHRLHGGIFCLSKGKKTLIVGIDNRAIEIGREIGLQTTAYGDMTSIENWVNSEIELELNLPWRDIDAWRDQFQI